MTPEQAIAFCEECKQLAKSAPPIYVASEAVDRILAASKKPKELSSSDLGNCSKIKPIW